MFVILQNFSEVRYQTIQTEDGRIYNIGQIYIQNKGYQINGGSNIFSNSCYMYSSIICH